MPVVHRGRELGEVGPPLEKELESKSEILGSPDGSIGLGPRVGDEKTKRDAVRDLGTGRVGCVEDRARVSTLQLGEIGKETIVGNYSHRRIVVRDLGTLVRSLARNKENPLVLWSDWKREDRSSHGDDLYRGWVGKVGNCLDLGDCIDSLDSDVAPLSPW